MIVRSQDGVHLEEIPLIEEDAEALDALRLLQKKGYAPDQVYQAYNNLLEPVPTTRVRERQAMRGSLDMRVKNETRQILVDRGLNVEGRELDRQHLGHSNFVVLKSAIDRQVNAAVSRQSGERHEFTRQELEKIERDFPQIIERVIKEVFNVKN